MLSAGTELGKRLRVKDLSAAPKAVSLLENRNKFDDALLLLKELDKAEGHIIGITGPPGVGKSSLISQLISEWRKQNKSVAVLAVDPSSRYSGGAILGDRARIDFDPHDKQLFIRSSAADDNLGGLAWSTHLAAFALACAFDIVVVETVGVGQSEGDIADVADTIVVIIQPGSGDALQYLKAGIMEIPDILAVNKMDLGAVSQVAFSALKTETRTLTNFRTPVIATSTVTPVKGITELIEALEEHQKNTDIAAIRKRSRKANAIKMLIHEYGQDAIRTLQGLQQITNILEKQPSEETALELFQILEKKYLLNRN
jgi:LAO/AO transport system kinase